MATSQITHEGRNKNLFIIENPKTISKPTKILSREQHTGDYYLFFFLEMLLILITKYFRNIKELSNHSLSLYDCSCSLSFFSPPNPTMKEIKTMKATTILKCC